MVIFCSWRKTAVDAGLVILASTGTVGEKRDECFPAEKGTFDSFFHFSDFLFCKHFTKSVVADGYKPAVILKKDEYVRMEVLDLAAGNFVDQSFLLEGKGQHEKAVW